MNQSHQLWSTSIKYSISPNQLYFLDCCKNKIKPAAIINQEAEALICRAKGFLTEDNELSSTALYILEEFQTHLVKTKKKVSREVLGEDFLAKVNEYREIFPKQRLPSGELARQSVKELTDKFVWFFKTYPEYNWDLVLDAADYYIHLKSKVNYEYTVTSSYFIQKTNIHTKSVKSLLADYCQQLIDDPNLLSI